MYMDTCINYILYILHILCIYIIYVIYTNICFLSLGCNVFMCPQAFWVKIHGLVGAGPRSFEGTSLVVRSYLLSLGRSVASGSPGL